MCLGSCITSFTAWWFSWVLYVKSFVKIPRCGFFYTFASSKIDINCYLSIGELRNFGHTLNCDAVFVIELPKNMNKFNVIYWFSAWRFLVQCTEKRDNGICSSWRAWPDRVSWWFQSPFSWSPRGLLLVLQ